MSTVQYIGARYVPKFYVNSLDGSTEWEVNVTYEPLTWVTLSNNSMYISRKTVPDNIGTPASNPDYWLEVGQFNGYIQNLQDQIDAINEELGVLEDARNDKKMLLIADSYGMHPRATVHWTDQIQVLYPSARAKSISSIGFATDTALNPDFNFLGQLTEFYNELTQSERDEITDIVVCGGWNDARFLTQGGDATTIQTRIVEFVDYANTNFKNALVHVGFIAWQTPDNGQPGDTTMGDLNRACFIYEYTRHTNLHVLNGVDAIMKNCAYQDISFFHPNDSGGVRLGLGILSAMFGGFTYSNSKTLSNADVTWGAGNSGTIQGHVDTQGNIIKFYMMITGLTADVSGDSTLFTFNDDALPWGHNEGVIVDIYDFAHDKMVYGSILSTREFDVYARTGAQTYSSGVLIVTGMIDAKYN